MQNYQRQAVVILGMHRSGTSAVAGTMVRLGLAPPLTPLPASGDNPSGFYESFPVVQLNHQMLLVAGCAWNLCLTFEPDRLDSLLQEGDRRIIAETLRREFAGAAGFVLKDPRLCLTLPAWLPALGAAGDEVCVLLVVRHPREVAHSLAHRNQLSEVETIPNWLHHMLEAERLSRGLNRAVVFYDDLLDRLATVHDRGEQNRTHRVAATDDRHGAGYRWFRCRVVASSYGSADHRRYRAAAGVRHGQRGLDLASTFMGYAGVAGRAGLSRSRAEAVCDLAAAGLSTWNPGDVSGT